MANNGDTAIIGADSPTERVNDLLNKIENFWSRTSEANEDARRKGVQMSAEQAIAFDREEADLKAKLKEGLADMQSIEEAKTNATIAENMDMDQSYEDFRRNTTTVESMFQDIYTSGRGNFVILPPAVSSRPSRNDKFRVKLNSGVYQAPARGHYQDPRDRDDDVEASKNSTKWFLQEVVSAPAGALSMISSSDMEFSPKEHETGRIYNALDRSLLRLQSDVTRGTTDFPELTTFISRLDQPHAYVGPMLKASRINLKVTPYSTEPIKMALVRTTPNVGQPASETTSVARTDPGYGQVTLGAERTMWTGGISNDAKYSSFVNDVMGELAETAAYAVQYEMNERLTTGTTSGDHTTIGLVNAIRGQSSATGVDATDYQRTFTLGSSATDNNINLETLLTAQHALNIGCSGPKVWFMAHQQTFGGAIQNIRTDNASGDINSMWPIIDYQRRNLMEGILYGLITEIALVNNHMASTGFNTAATTFAAYGNGDAWCSRYTPVEYHINDTTLADSDEWFLRARGWCSGNIYWSTAAKGIPFIDIRTP